MAQIIEQGDIFGRIGKAFGEGAGKQIERNTLASGIERLAQDKNLTDAQRYGQLLRLPGGAENASTLIPAIRNSNQTKAFLDEEKKGIPSAATPEVVKIPRQITNEEKPSGSVLSSPDQIKEAKQRRLQIPTPQDENRLARQYLAEGRKQTVEEARDLAKEILQGEYTAQNAKVSALREGFNRRLQLDLQSTGLQDYAKSIGQITQSLLDHGEHEVLDKGRTPEEVEKELSDITLALGKAMTQTKGTGVSLGSFIPGSGKNEKARSADLRAQKKIFEKYGFGDIYDDLASAAAGITPIKAASILDPIKNKDLEKELSKHKKSTFNFFSGISSNQRLGDKDLDSIISKIEPTDNLLAIEYDLREKKINIADFKERLLEPQNYHKLTEQQKVQLNKPANNSILDDLLFTTF